MMQELMLGGTGVVAGLAGTAKSKSGAGDWGLGRATESSDMDGLAKQATRSKNISVSGGFNQFHCICIRTNSVCAKTR